MQIRIGEKHIDIHYAVTCGPMRPKGAESCSGMEGVLHTWKSTDVLMNMFSTDTVNYAQMSDVDTCVRVRIAMG